MPSGPIRDGKKLKEFQGMILRYKATLHNPKVYFIGCFFNREKRRFNLFSYFNAMVFI
jgi:hypothetical protein